METDKIVSGFNAAEDMHLYTGHEGVIRDGDSSVMCDIQQYIPIWGHIVMKMVCANHVIKCYRNRLEKFFKTSHNTWGKGN